MKQNGRRFFFIALAGCLVIATGCSHRTELTGAWVKQSGDPNMPDEVAIKQADRSFKISYYAASGVETTTFLCDGAEHPLSTFPLKMTYTAALAGDTLLLRKNIKSIWYSATDLSATEKWSVNGDGTKLSVSVQGTETTFGRRPFLSSLFRSDP